MIRLGMSRGLLLVDESVYDLAPLLSDLNFRVLAVPPGMPDEQIIATLLSGRIFVTKNPKDFLLAALEYEIGLIGVSDAVMANPAKVAKAISRAYVEHELRHSSPFRLTIGPISTAFLPLTDTSVAKELQSAQKRKR